MKKFLILISIVGICNYTASAKKVKFAVDMTGTALGVGGVHIMGDFQTIAGAGSDFVPTPMFQEGTTDIYSLIVDIPAFTKYEYKFLSGEQTYDAEFVPVESRVGYNFDDNRWIYVDSLANDTTFVGAILFAQNAPAGLTLVRYLVDLQYESSVSANGAHVAGSAQGWDPASTRLYNFDASTVYEIINYVTTGTYEYKFYNGNSSGDSETIPGTCAVNNNRELVVSHDTVLAAVCFSSCGVCNALSLNETKSNNSNLFPNPTEGATILQFKSSGIYTIEIMNSIGQNIEKCIDFRGSSIQLNKNSWAAGIYFVKTTNKTTNLTETIKLVVK